MMLLLILLINFWFTRLLPAMTYRLGGWVSLHAAPNYIACTQSSIGSTQLLGCLIISCASDHAKKNSPDLHSTESLQVVWHVHSVLIVAI